MITVKERFHFSNSLLVAGSGKPICLIDNNGMETYNDIRKDIDKTRFIGIDEI
jgi:hypothetical protein